MRVSKMHTSAPEYIEILYRREDSGTFEKIEESKETTAFPEYLKVEKVLLTKTIGATHCLTNPEKKTFSPKLRCNTNQMITGLRRTQKEGMYSGDKLERKRNTDTRKIRSFCLFQFSKDGEFLKVFYFRRYHLHKNRIPTFLDDFLKENPLLNSFPKPIEN